MTYQSTLDELEEIERSARVGPQRMSPPPPIAVRGSRRRGSAIAVIPAVPSFAATEDVSNPHGIQGEILVDFPVREEPTEASPPPVRQVIQEQQAPVQQTPTNVTRPEAASPEKTKKSVVVLASLLDFLHLVDFDDSDSDKDENADEEEVFSTPEAGVAEPTNHRTLVGGFAAAAFEAKRADHFQGITRTATTTERAATRQDPAPSI